MYITDLEGRNIYITDLEKAIEQADAFRQYRPTENEFAELDKTLAEYWNDIYEQLIQLKN